jgi:nicotinamide-nucleotide amidase
MDEINVYYEECEDCWCKVNMMEMIVKETPDGNCIYCPKCVAHHKYLEEESKKADIILITGGLGPTADDITKPLLGKYFNGNLVMDQPTLDHITHIFERVLKKPMLDRNIKQAEVPDTCKVLKNEMGTAPGMLFNKDNKIFIARPGVPHEMQFIMTNHVLPLLLEKYQTGFIEHRTLLTSGIGESFLAELIKDFDVIIVEDLSTLFGK